MTMPSNTFETYQAIGDREDLIDVITNISPEETWLTSNSGKARATARYHEWQTDALATPGANAVAEGSDATTAAITPTVRTGNYCQILRKVWSVTETQEIVDKAGRTSELSYQMQKFMKELANDIEYAMVINASSVAGSSGVARQMKGALGWIATNTHDKGSVALTEIMLNDSLQEIWKAGGKPSNVICGGFQKRAISNFTVNTREVNADDKSVTRAIDIYKSDFGEIAIHPHYIMESAAPGSLVTFGDMSLWNKAWLRPVKPTDLAKTGSSTNKMIEAELTLESRAEKGSGSLINLAIA